MRESVDLSSGRRSGRWWRGPCPRCSAGHPGDDALAVDLATGWRSCWRCGESGRDVAAVVVRIDPAHEAEQRERLRSRACRLFAEARSIRADDPVDRYLRGRSLRPVGDAWPTDIRHHPRLRHPSGHVGPALVAMVRDVAARPVALARTWLTSRGEKAAVQPVRMTLGASQAGAVRLGSIGTRGEVALAEGIEDALAVMVMCPGLSAFATLGTSGMRTLVLPANVSCVVLVPDRDEAGAGAARELAARLREEGRDVILRWPRSHDANDDLRAMEVAHARRR
jgi:putative DNA primase/helicase